MVPSGAWSQPLVGDFSASPPFILPPATTTTLSWQVSGADTVSIAPGVGAVAAEGSVVVSPAADTTTYTLTATGSGTSVTRELTVKKGSTEVPNIVFFVVDDYGWQDTSYEFWEGPESPTLWNQLYRTPAMERLAAEGRAFTTAYASGPVCTASRVSILLGQAPVRHGTTFITGLRGWDTDTIRSAEQDNAGLVGEEQTRTLPRLLSERGYRTVNVGKAHFGPADPLEVGFQRNRYGNEKGSPHGDGSDVYHVLQPNRPEIHLSEALTRAALQEIDRSRADGLPFFLYLSHYAVHDPILEDTRFSGEYPSVSGTTRAMGTLISGMDRSLNDLLDHLERRGIAEKTLVFFMSDHGGWSYRNGSTYYDEGPSPTRKFNWPLRGGKNDAYEGGLRIPFVASWARHDPDEPFQQALPIAPGSRESRAIIQADLMPTLFNILGYPGDIPEVVDGRDISGYLTGDPDFTREDKFFWHAPNYWVRGQAEPDSAMREGHDKLVYTYDTAGGRWELFDLAADIGEQTNLMDARPETGVRMARELIRYLESEGAHYPVQVAGNRELRPVMPAQASQVDLDGDGLPDGDEDPNRNGLVDPGETDPDAADTDGDRLSDGDELRLGRDPLDATSYFHLKGEALGADSIRLTWPSLPGTSFTIERGPSPADWDEVVASGVPAAAAGASTSYRVTLPEAAGRSGFFRVVLEE